MARQVLTIPDVPSTLLTQSAGDARYLPLTGGALTGPVTMTSPSNPAFLIDGSHLQLRNSAGGYSLWANQTGDTLPRLLIRASGAIEWGAGSGLVSDTILERSAQNVLQLTGSLNPNANNFRDLGTTALHWRNLSLSGTLGWGP